MLSRRRGGRSILGIMWVVACMDLATLTTQGHMNKDFPAPDLPNGE